MQTHTSEYDPDAALRDVGIKISFLDSYSGLEMGTEDIISLVLTECLDITCDSFPSRSIKLEAIDRLGLSFASEETDYVGSRFEVLIGINGEYVSGGIYYVNEVDTSDMGLTVSISGSDRVDTYMDNYMTGLYTSSSVTMSTLLNYKSGALYGLDVYCEDDLLELYVHPNMLTTVDSQRNCLLRLAQADGMASIWVARDGVVHFERVAGKTGYSATITVGSVLEYSGLKLGSHVDYIEVSNETGVSTWGQYSSGCLADFLDNEFIDSQNLIINAERYYISKNQRFELILKTRCNPAFEPGDRVLVLKPDGSEIGEFTITSQTIHFDKGGLWSKLTLNAPSPTDS